jgi:transcription initiation factor TFIIH subunit 3
MIDGCPVGGRDSAFLQQASHLTKGVYLRPPRPDGLLQYLLSVFAADGFSRRFLALPRCASVDFRASCFCHKRSIDQVGCSDDTELRIVTLRVWHGATENGS